MANDSATTNSDDSKRDTDISDVQTMQMNAIYYQNGLFLDQTLMTSEQSFFLNLFKAMNLGLYAQAGVLQGFEISASGSQLTVGAGVAIGTDGMVMVYTGSNAPTPVNISGSGDYKVYIYGATSSLDPNYPKKSGNNLDYEVVINVGKNPSQFDIVLGAVNVTVTQPGSGGGPTTYSYSDANTPVEPMMAKLVSTVIPTPSS